MDCYDGAGYGTLEYQLADIAGLIPKERADADRAESMRRRNTAKEAQRTGRAAKRPRRVERQGPKRSRMYARAHSMAPFLDQRLTCGARVCLALVLALCGKHGYCTTTKASLAELLGVSTRAVGRYLHELADPLFDIPYLIRETAKTSSGMDCGIHLRVCRELLPYYNKLFRASTGGTGSPPFKTDSVKEGNRKPTASRMVWRGYHPEYGYIEGCDVSSRERKSRRPRYRDD